MWPLKPRRNGMPPAEWMKQNSFLLGGERVPTRLAEFDTVLSGGKGTGKTTALIALMLSLIQSRIASGAPFNVHAYTPKPDDFYPLLRAVFEPLGFSVRSTNPFMNDSWSWDGSMNLTDPPKIDELTAAVIKDDGRDQGRFFRQTAQLLLRGVIQSLATTHPRPLDDAACGEHPENAFALEAGPRPERAHPSSPLAPLGGAGADGPEHPRDAPGRTQRA